MERRAVPGDCRGILAVHLAEAHQEESGREGAAAMSLWMGDTGRPEQHWLPCSLHMRAKLSALPS